MIKKKKNESRIEIDFDLKTKLIKKKTSNRFSLCKFQSSRNSKQTIKKKKFKQVFLHQRMDYQKDIRYCKRFRIKRYLLNMLFPVRILICIALLLLTYQHFKEIGEKKIRPTSGNKNEFEKDEINAVRLDKIC